MNETSTRLNFLLRRGWTPINVLGVSRRYWQDPNDPKRVLLAGEAYNLQMQRESRVPAIQTGRNFKQRAVWGKK
jgi:hypothetical protein